MKRALQIIKNCAVWALLIASLFMMVFTVLSVTVFDNTSRNIFGIRMFTVVSDSMKATDFDAGDIIIVNGNIDTAKLEPGDIITYISQSPESYMKTVTHKIRSIKETSSGYRSFVVYGTTSDTNDTIPVGQEYVIGKYLFALPKAGHFFTFLKTTPGYMLCILLPFALLISYQGIQCVILWRKYKQDQQDVITQERAEIEAERRENEKMKEELERLRKQLQGDNSDKSDENAKDS